MVDPNFRDVNVDPLFTDSDWTHVARSLSLSPRELQVVRNVFSGLTDREIGVQMGVSEHTVRSHVASIHKKLDLSNRSGLFICVLRAIHCEHSPDG